VTVALGARLPSLRSAPAKPAVLRRVLGLRPTVNGETPDGAATGDPMPPRNEGTVPTRHPSGAGLLGRAEMRSWGRSGVIVSESRPSPRIGNGADTTKEAYFAPIVLRFTWDPVKAELNLRKHGVSFAEARTVFGDPLNADMPDPDHSRDELRFVTIGKSENGQLLVVIYAEPEPDWIHIISARRTTPGERRKYEELG